MAPPPDPDEPLGADQRSGIDDHRDHRDHRLLAPSPPPAIALRTALSQRIVDPDGISTVGSAPAGAVATAGAAGGAGQFIDGKNTPR